MPREAAQIVQVDRVLGRDDEAELVAISPAPLLEGLEVGGIGLGTISLPALPVACHPIALDVAQVRGDRVRAGFPEHHEAGLDDHAPSMRAEATAGHAGRDAAPAKGRCRASCQLARRFGAGL
ncbi:hypothetical protein D3C86_1639130 [compost metagenome]